MKIVKRFISWRIRGLFVAEKRLKVLLQADTKEGASDKELDALYKTISAQLKAISDMQNEIMTLELINDAKQKWGFMRVITWITPIELPRYCMICENDYFFHVIYVMFLELLQATKIHPILISRGCDPT